MSTRILVVEDSPTQGERLRLVLEAAGYNAEVANDAEAALDMLRSTPFALVISDIVMPGLSGYDLCQRIRAEETWKNLPVILLTTRKDPLDIIKGLECGADSFYTKPYNPDRLIERIHHILYNKSLRSQGKLKVGIELSFFGKVVTINSEKEQILDLLVSTFEDIVQANRDLEKSREELSKAKAEVEHYAAMLKKRAESSEERYHSIVNEMAEGIVTISEQGTIESTNPEARSMFGYQEDELVGKRINLIIPEQPHTEGELDLASRLPTFEKTRGRRMGEVEGRHKDGTLFPVSLIISEMNTSGGRTFILITRDLTQERKTEQQLRQAQKMEAIGQLTGGIAHDFNNLLTIIIGNAELLSECLPGNNEMNGLAEMIMSAGERGSELTRRLLAFARRQPLEPKVVNVNELVERMEGLVRRTLGAQIEMHFALKPDLWPTMVDPGQLENALLNLCINARDAMPKGGRLTIETANKKFDDDNGHKDQNIDFEPGEYVMLAVSDTGIGIPPENIDHLFVPFFTTKEKGKGTGLGLPMVYGFVKQSHGHIRIYSETQEGTTVLIYLPRLNCGAAANISEDETASAMGGGETILLVEDDDLVRDYAERQLALLGYNVIVAPNGRAALDIISRCADIDLLFTDMVMPGGMNGREVYEAALELRPNLKVLYASGYAENAILHQGRVGHDVHLLSKPYRRADLARKLREAMES